MTMGSDILEGCLTALLIIVIAVVLSFILTYPEMLLWNWLMPKFFGVPEITFWEMFGFNVLLGMLFPRTSFNKS